MLGQPIANGDSWFQMSAKSGTLISGHHCTCGIANSPAIGPTITPIKIAGSIPNFPIVSIILFFLRISAQIGLNRQKYATAIPTAMEMGYLSKRPVVLNSPRTAAIPPPIKTPALTAFGTTFTILPPKPVIPNTKKISPRHICTAIKACVRSAPIT